MKNFRLYVLVIAFLLVMIAGIVKNAGACDYGTELDPRLLNTDYVVISEIKRPNNVILRTVANKFHQYPQFVVLIVEIGNKVSCYWYLNKDFKLEVYGYIPETKHFGVIEFDTETEKKITNALMGLAGVTKL